MSNEPAQASSGHLAYYEQHGISPVRYRMDNVEAHFDRRDSLYRSLGLPPVAFRGSRVLEVAPGSGQNSLYVAACLPRSYDLIEPNPAGVRDIRSAYDGLQRPHTKPTIRSERFELFQSSERYDVVICENWLGSLPHEVDLIRKLASLVAPGGVLVLTIVPLAGVFPNIMRRLLALRIADPSHSFEQRTEQMTSAFGPHLATIAGMTRSVRDWVHDCVLNPHYVNVALSLDTVLDAIGSEMEALATFPRFTPDWRWFKVLSGEQRRFNEIMLGAYRENLHNFIDYRKSWPPRPASANESLDTAFVAIHEASLAWQAAIDAGSPAPVDALVKEIGERLSDVSAGISQVDRSAVDAVAELKAVWNQAQPNVETVRNMRLFGSLFGRETVYLSLTRPRAG